MAYNFRKVAGMSAGDQNSFLCLDLCTLGLCPIWDWIPLERFFVGIQVYHATYMTDLLPYMPTVK